MHTMRKLILSGLLVTGLISCKDQSGSSKPVSVHSNGKSVLQPDTIASPPPVVQHWQFDTLTLNGDYFVRQLKFRPTVPVSERRKNPLFAVFTPLERTQSDQQFYFFDTLLKHPAYPAVLIGTATENEQNIWLVQQQPGKATPFFTLVYYEDFVEYLNQCTSVASPKMVSSRHLEYDEQDHTQTNTTVVVVDSSTGLLQKR